MKKLFILVFGLLISCGCPKEQVSTVPTLVVPDPEPTTSAEPESESESEPEPEPEPKPDKIMWYTTVDPVLIDIANNTNACFLIYFESSIDNHNDVIDKMLLDQRIVKMVNKRFFAAMYLGPDDVRTDTFGIPLDELALLLVPTDDTSYLYFNPVKDGKIELTLSELKEEFLIGVSLESFQDCEEVKESIKMD